MSSLAFAPTMSGSRSAAIFWFAQQQQQAAAAAAEAKRKRDAALALMALRQPLTPVVPSPSLQAQITKLQSQYATFTKQPTIEPIPDPGSWWGKRRHRDWGRPGGDWRARERQRLGRQIRRIAGQIEWEKRNAKVDTVYVAHLQAQLDRAKQDLAKIPAPIEPSGQPAVPVALPPLPPAPKDPVTTTPAVTTPAVTTTPTAAATLPGNWKRYYQQKIRDLTRQVAHYKKATPGSEFLKRLEVQLARYEDALSSKTSGVSGLGFSMSSMSPWTIGAALLAGYLTLCPPGIKRRKRILGF